MESCNEVLLDTNFLLMPVKYKFDFVDEIHRLVPAAKLITLSPVVKELEKLKQGALGKKIIEEKGVEVKEANGFADDAIVKYASQHRCAVCTNDKELQERLKGKPIIFMRGKSKLEMKGVIK